jgi:hypothetical protein
LPEDSDANGKFEMLGSRAGRVDAASQGQESHAVWPNSGSQEAVNVNEVFVIVQAGAKTAKSGWKA